MKFTTFKKSGAQIGDHRWAIIRNERLRKKRPEPESVFIDFINNENRISIFGGGFDDQVNSYLYGDLINPPGCVEIDHSDDQE